MPWLETILVSRLVVFTLILGRVGALVMSAPVFGNQAFPIQLRALLAVALALLIAPLHIAESPVEPENLFDYGRLLANEVLLGLLLGVGTKILMSGVLLAGQIISQLSGLSLAEVFDPSLEAEASAVTQLLHFLALALFVIVGGHRIVMQALLDTFIWAPPGQAALCGSYSETVVTLLGQSFQLGLRAAAPLMAVLLLATLLSGLIGRAIPQINVLAFGLCANSLLTLGTLLVTLGAVAWIFQEPLIAALELLPEIVQRCG